ncbi:MAG: hypothetical protein WCA46_22715 [Actinocatenispora sp.]
MTTTSFVRAASEAADRQVAPVRRWASRTGALALVGIGVAHTVVNARGFAAERGGSWLVFMIFAPGVSLLAFAIAVAAWRYGSRVRSGAAAAAYRTVVAVGAVLLCLTAVSVLRSHPGLVWVPLGPGPWSVIGGLALTIAAAAPATVRPTTR